MEFTITITDPSKLDGITAARAAYNASLPQTIVVNEDEVPNPALLVTDQDYVQFVMDHASQSYANQYGT